MPVSLLFCEGGPKSPDIRVLNKLLVGIQVQGKGGKYRMGDRVLARRDADPPNANAVWGILDGDFIKDWAIPTNRPRPWHSSEGHDFGWRWERKEIENYLIDPDVVQNALPLNALNVAAYKRALEAARDSLCLYQAARTALSANRRRFRDLESSFGKEKGKQNHRFPERLDEASCLAGIREAVAYHQTAQIVQPENVIDSFQRYKGECQTGGMRYQSFMHSFAGKDLLWMMRDWFSQNGFKSPWVFLEMILHGIRQTADDIANWLPEWKELKEIIFSIP
ncbi:MAG: hypothetical protein NTX50_01520 [Candidatus Sumerlaeota bacterium]|nr:hypothetical protein [Candidatus Sumerlaeota bacterium]